MILDAIASFFCFSMAISCFIIHVLSSPRRGHWIDLPPYVRIGFFMAGAAVLYRGVDFAILSGEVPPVSVGHINEEGLIATIMFSYTFMALAVHILKRTFPVRVWNRLKYIEGLATCANGGALAMLASFGVRVIPPNAAPETVKRVDDVSSV